MFCPDCGMENSTGQKFCRRCGVNLAALDRAREIVNEVATAAPANAVEPAQVLRIVAWVSGLGFMFTTAVVIVLSLIQYAGSSVVPGPPIGVSAGVFGYGAMVLICRQLLKLVNLSARVETKAQPPTAAQANYAPPPAMRGNTNRALGEASVYHSVTEQDTRQFEAERRAKS